MPTQSVSIIMPVFNTGSYLREAVDSLIKQEPFDGCPVPTFELLIVDDGSTDPETLKILNEVKQLPFVRVLPNQRKKGASGARNTGILQARGAWIGFLDSDDLYFPHALAMRWKFILEQPSSAWVAAQFFLMRPESGIERKPFSLRSPNLYAAIAHDYDRQQPSLLRRPVELLTKNCMLGILTVLIKRELILRKGMFDENLRRAEDYHLWFKCALDTDLWMLPHDIAIYRLRPNSLSRTNEPVFYYEHTMIDLLLGDSSFSAYRSSLLRRFDLVLSDYCQFYRKVRQPSVARHWALHWVRRRPMVFSAWKQLVASALRI